MPKSCQKDAGNPGWKEKKARNIGPRTTQPGSKEPGQKRSWRPISFGSGRQPPLSQLRKFLRSRIRRLCTELGHRIRSIPVGLGQGLAHIPGLNQVVAEAPDEGIASSGGVACAHFARWIENPTRPATYREPVPDPLSFCRCSILITSLQHPKLALFPLESALSLGKLPKIAPILGSAFQKSAQFATCRPIFHSSQPPPARNSGKPSHFQPL
ncbi:Uncharacterised protein [Arcanobacterium haemolyticum]|nr:Uncharacterised protein [Arcanobacterium haemolyticum]